MHANNSQATPDQAAVSQLYATARLKQHEAACKERNSCSSAAAACYAEAAGALRLFIRYQLEDAAREAVQCVLDDCSRKARQLGFSGLDGNAVCNDVVRELELQRVALSEQQRTCNFEELPFADAGTPETK